VKPIRWPPDHALAGSEVTRLIACSARRGDVSCGRQFVQHYWSESGEYLAAKEHPSTVTKTPEHCPQCERRLLHVAAR
jgi:hypothetical protein